MDYIRHSEGLTRPSYPVESGSDYRLVSEQVHHSLGLILGGIRTEAKQHYAPTRGRPLSFRACNYDCSATITEDVRLSYHIEHDRPLIQYPLPGYIFSGNLRIQNYDYSNQTS